MIFWTVENGKLIRLERSGKCNQRGKCCKDYRITFKFEVGSVVQDHGAEEDVQEADWSNREGWSMFLAQGTWWYFGDFRITRDSEFEGCPSLKDGSVCANWQGEDFRPICRYWPLHPSNLECFPDCGFSFEVVEEESDATNDVSIDSVD